MSYLTHLGSPSSMHPLFEITVNWNTVPKIIPDSCSRVKRVKMAEKPQKTGKELCLRGLLSENGRPEIFTQNGNFSGQIKRVGISAWNLCWSALGVAQGETSAGLWWFCYHSCTSVALTTSKVLVTCVTTYRTDLRDNTRGLRNNQCTVATWHMHLLGVYSRFQVTGMIKGIFWVWNFRFQVFWGYENLASIYISWRLISVNKVRPKKVHVVI